MEIDGGRGSRVWVKVFDMIKLAAIGFLFLSLFLFIFLFLFLFFFFPFDPFLLGAEIGYFTR